MDERKIKILIQKWTEIANCGRCFLKEKKQSLAISYDTVPPGSIWISFVDTLSDEQALHKVPLH
jgi:hypothetical protein